MHQICFRVKTFGALWLQLFVPAQSRKHWRHSNVVFRNLRDQFLWPLCKISSVDWRQSSETKETLFCTNIWALSWINIVCRCITVQYLGVATLLSIIIVAEQLSVSYFSHLILLITPIKRRKVCLCTKFTTYNFSLSKSSMMKRVTLHIIITKHNTSSLSLELTTIIRQKNNQSLLTFIKTGSSLSGSHIPSCNNTTDY